MKIRESQGEERIDGGKVVLRRVGGIAIGKALEKKGKNEREILSAPQGGGKKDRNY